MSEKEKKDIKDRLVWGAKELQEAGFGRSMAYQLLNRSDVPTFRIGNRIFVYRELFEEWLKSQTKAD